MDLGAGSGRAILGRFAARAPCYEVHRFLYPPRRRRRSSALDVAQIFGGASKPACARRGEARGRGRAAGAQRRRRQLGGGLRDRRRRGRAPRGARLLSRRADGASWPRSSRRYLARRSSRRTGIQFLPFNTIFSSTPTCARACPRGEAPLADPRPVHHLGSPAAPCTEYTNASTTQLLDAARRQWDDGLFERLGLPRHLMPGIGPPGRVLGLLRSRLRGELGLAGRRGRTRHPRHGRAPWPALRCGRVGPTSPRAPGRWSAWNGRRRFSAPRRRGATSRTKAASYGTVRFLKNVMGLWILERMPP